MMAIRAFVSNGNSGDPNKAGSSKLKLEAWDMKLDKDLNPDCLADSSGHKREVILPLINCEELLGDLNDLAVASERVDELIVAKKIGDRRTEMRGVLSIILKGL